MDGTPIPGLSSQKSLQYDVELGGKTQLPYAFNVEEYVAGHIEELKALTNAIENPTKTKLAFQRLPKHMRRRVMSHNVKRMPARLRESHAKYLQKQNLKTPHRPSRKYRRRPSNLVAEYNRRSKRVAWLETHIWHAKRFAMVEAWGYKVASKANEKSYRASVRALDRHCLLQDISYLVCLELSGPESYLIYGLSEHFDSRACFTPGAKIYRTGSREGHGMFYARGRYPYEAIGNVKFLWRPTMEENEDTRTLWLWTHPSYYQTIVDQLNSTFSLVEEEEQMIDDLNQTNSGESTSKPSKMDSQSCPPPSKPPLSNKNSKSGNKIHQNHSTSTKMRKKQAKIPNAELEQTKLAVRNIPHTRIRARSNVRSGVRMRVLKDALNRFELRGPLSGAVIARALHLFTTRQGKEDTPPNLPVSLLNTVLHHEEEEDDRDTEEDTRFKLWRLLRSYSPSQFPPRVVLGAVVRDPRFNMPAQRTRNELDTPDSDEDHISLSSLLPSSSLSISPVWDPELRDWVSTNKPSTHSINTLFSSRLVPGVPKPEELKYALPIPLMLIQQEGVRRSSLGSNYKQIGFGSGWDIIFPSGWSMPLLLGLIFNGARVGGLREASQLSVQMRSEPSLPCDTRAWRELEKQRSEEAREKYFRKPPKKRPNFIRLGNVTPFSFHWTMLLRDWHSRHSEENIRVEDNSDETIKMEDEEEEAMMKQHGGIEENNDETMEMEEEDKEGMMKDDGTGKARQKQKHQPENKEKQSQKQEKQSQQQQKKPQKQEKHQSTAEHEKRAVEHQQTLESIKPYVLRDKIVIEKLNTLIAKINAKSTSTKACKDGKGGHARSSKLMQGSTKQPNTGEKIKNISSNNFGKEFKSTRGGKSNLRPNFGNESPSNRGGKSNFRSNFVKKDDTSSIPDKFEELQAEILNNVQSRDNCLVQVNVQIIKRGTMNKYSHICLPLESELEKLGERRYQNAGSTQGSNIKQGFKGNCKIVHSGKIRKEYSRKQEHLGVQYLERELDESKLNQKDESKLNETLLVNNNNQIQEPLHRDGNQLVRKTLKEEHKKLLLRLKRRRVRAKKKTSYGDFENPKRVKRKGVHPTKDLVHVYQGVMRKLWIPNVEEELKEDIIDSEVVETEGVGDDNIIKEEKITDQERVESDGYKMNIVEEKEGTEQTMEREKAQDRNKLFESVKKQTNEANTLEERLKKTNISIVDEQVVKNYLKKVNRNIQEENSAAGKSSSNEKSLKLLDSETKKASGQVIKERKRCLRDEMDIDKIENTPKRKKTGKSEQLTPGAENLDKELEESKYTEKMTLELSQTTEKALKEFIKITSSKLEVKTKLESYDSDVTDRILSRLQPIRSLRFVASHELFGFVTSLSYHSTAQYGQGCVSLNGLLECMRRCVHVGGKVRVLVRRSDDVNYHWAEISVL